MSEVKLKNKKAYFNYEIIDTYEAGISLVGTEIKSIRKNNLSFTDSYCLFIDKKLIVRSMHIKEYENASFNQHDPKRDRDLILTRKELSKLSDSVRTKGLTIIPLKVYVVNGWAKVLIGLAKGKNNFDKRNSIKEKDMKRDQDREMK